MDQAISRFNAFKKSGQDFSKEANLIVGTFMSYKSLETYLSAFVSKARNSDILPILDKDEVIRAVKRHPSMGTLMHSRMVEAAIRFYMSNKFTKKLQVADPKFHRSVHFGHGLFSVNEYPLDKWLSETDIKNRKYPVKSVVEVRMDGVDGSFFIENYVKRNAGKYMMLRPKLMKFGNPSMTEWEVLFTDKSYDYYIDHIDMDYVSRRKELPGERTVIRK